MPKTPGTDDEPKLQKRYKTYFDTSDEQCVVSRKTSARWKSREETGVQYLWKVRNAKNDEDCEPSNARKYDPLLSNDDGCSSSSSRMKQEEEKEEDDVCSHSNDQGPSINDPERLINSERDSDHDICDNDYGVCGSEHSDNNSFSSKDCLSESYSNSSDEAISDAEVEDNDNVSCSGDDSYNFTRSCYEKWIMFEPSNVSVWEVFNMVQAISVRFKMSDEAQQSILEFTKIIAGPKFKNLNTTKYTMSKLYNPPDDKKAYVFYCPTCSTVLHEPIQTQNMTDKQTAVCNECSKNYLLTRSLDNYFLTVDIAYQLQTILENANVKSAIDENLQSIRNESSEQTSISDVTSSTRYKNCEFISKMKGKNVIVLTLNVNIDGAALFNTSKRSLWPIQAVINEIPAKSRCQFFILAALWITNAEPKASLMNVYVKYFIKQIFELMNKGLTITSNEGVTTTYFVTLFCLAVDTPARAILQNRMQFNGYYGCSWCYARGVYVQRAMKYPLTVELPSDRSHSEYFKDADTFESLRKNMSDPQRASKRYIGLISRSSRGSKGLSELTKLTVFDCVWGFSCEYLHSVLLGAARQQWEKWVDVRSTVCLSTVQKNTVDKRLVSIQPPNELHRLPRLLRDRAKWRGSEWKSWLLYYSVPCLIDILPEQWLQSYMRLVRATHTLLRTVITDDDLYQAEIDLIQYVGDSQTNYGESFMTFNIHSLLHLVESVRQNGPLWATSAFPFESKIGQLKRVVTGPKGVVEQIANRMLQSNTFKTLISTMPFDNESCRFCDNVYNHRPLLKHYQRTKEGAVLAGNLLNNNQKTTSRGTRYNRCIYRNVMFHSTSYTRPKKINNRIVELLDSTIIEIQHFAAIDNVCHIVGKKLETSPLQRGIELNHIRIVNSRHGDTMSMPITEIRHKLICVEIAREQEAPSDINLDSIHSNMYVCILPNTVEVQ